jgi:long-chain fatty acid transport protein
MGGAFTALSDDGAGGWYNPGGVAFAEKSSVSFIASLYGVVTGKIDNALGTGSAFHFSDINVVPSVTSAIRKWGEPDPETGLAPNALFGAIFVPDLISSDDRASLAGDENNAFFLSRNDQTLWVGGGYSRRMGNVGLGFALYGLMATSKQTLDFNVVGDAQRFFILTARAESTTYGVVGAAGIRWDINRRWRLGASFFSPQFGTGSRSMFVRVTANPTLESPAETQVLRREDLKAAPTLPFRAQLGVAYETGKWTFSADAIVLGPKEVWDNTELVSDGLDRRVKRNMVVNGSVGAELLLGAAFPLRMGLYTDFAANPKPDVNSNLDNTSHIDRYGASLSIGHRGEHVRLDLGLNVTYGKGEDLIPDNLDFSKLAIANATELLAYGFLATSYEF